MNFRTYLDAGWLNVFEQAKSSHSAVVEVLMRGRIKNDYYFTCFLPNDGQLNEMDTFMAHALKIIMLLKHVSPML